jgi:hypothetical protein
MIRCAKCGGPVRWTRNSLATTAYCPRVLCGAPMRSYPPTFIPPPSVVISYVVKEPLTFDGHGNFDEPSTTEVTR